MTSIFPIAYGMSKFISGVLGAKASPRVLLAAGLMATATVNIIFGFQARAEGSRVGGDGC